MNRKVSTLVALGLAYCSMQALSNPPAAAITKAPPTALRLVIPELKRYEAPAPKERNGLPSPRACYLGGDCLAMDSHPFEICQVSTKSCGDKLAEVLQVEQPKTVTKPAPPLQRISR